MVYRPQSDTLKYPSTRQSGIRDCNSPLRINILQKIGRGWRWRLQRVLAGARDDIAICGFSEESCNP
eukprot:537368-Prorocentrum_minimum.AAC.1